MLYSVMSDRKEYRIKYRKDNKRKLNEYSKGYYQSHKDVYKTKYYKYKHGDLRVMRSISSLNMDLDSTVKMGRIFERLAVSNLEGEIIDNNIDNFAGKFDIIWNGKKVDVKSRRKNHKGRWQFECRNYEDNDALLLFCLDIDIIIKVLLIPKPEVKLYMYIGNKSKYDKYEVLGILKGKCYKDLL